MWLWEVDSNVEAESIGLANTWLRETFCRRRKYDSDSWEFLLQGLLHIVVVSANADTAAWHSDELLKDLNREECLDESLWRSSVSNDQAWFDSEFVQSELEV